MKFHSFGSVKQCELNYLSRVANHECWRYRCRLFQIVQIGRHGLFEGLMLLVFARFQKVVELRELYTTFRDKIY